VILTQSVALLFLMLISHNIFSLKNKLYLTRFECVRLITEFDRLDFRLVRIVSGDAACAYLVKLAVVGCCHSLLVKILNIAFMCAFLCYALISYTQKVTFL
jgi:hypothetical protein